MYSKTSERKNFGARTASHSTKPLQSGRVDTLPPEARPEEQLYQKFREQFLALQTQHSMLCQQRDATLDHRLKRDLQQRITRLSVSRRQVLDAMNAAATGAFAQTFYFIARQMLTTELFGRIYDETEELIGRPRLEWYRKKDANGKGLAIRENDQPRFRRVDDKS
jgi:hypothetical protein